MADDEAKDPTANGGSSSDPGTPVTPTTDPSATPVTPTEDA